MGERSRNSALVSFAFGYLGKQGAAARERFEGAVGCGDLGCELVSFGHERRDDRRCGRIQSLLGGGHPALCLGQANVQCGSFVGDVGDELFQFVQAAADAALLSREVGVLSDRCRCVTASCMVSVGGVGRRRVFARGVAAGE